MSMCGPVDPCAQCRPIYERDPRYVPDEDNPGSYRIAHDEDHRKRSRQVRTTAMPSQDRLPVGGGSRTARRARRNAKCRRRS